MNAPPVRIVVFAKAPGPGQAKTRLIPALGADGAARLAARLLDDALARAFAAAVGTVELCASPVDDRYWQPYRSRPDLRVTGQGDGDLGTRMARSSRRVTEAGEAILLIGTDCPALDGRVLREAAARLADHDAVLVPALDGGYVAIGLRRFDPQVFDGLPWSTEAVARLTLARIAALGWRCAVLGALPDIDEPPDLVHLPPAWR